MIPTKRPPAQDFAGRSVAAPDAFLRLLDRERVREQGPAVTIGGWIWRLPQELPC